MTVGRIVLILVVVAGIFFAGALTAHAVNINLSAGPVAEGQKTLDQANAGSIQTQSAINQATADQALANQKLIDDATRQATINRIVGIEIVMRWAGGFALGIALIFGAILFVAFFGAMNYRLTIKPVPSRSGVQVGWTLPMLPFMFVHTSDDAPGATTLFLPGQKPTITASENLPLLALSRALLGEGDLGRTNNMQNIAHAAQALALVLDSVPQRRLQETNDESR